LPAIDAPVLAVITATLKVAPAPPAVPSAWAVPTATVSAPSANVVPTFS
jgi:hypothetical protein